uniref:BZIP domain-containing protein n=1 Tax=Syphacia muris TaxID=451379 RepID=A0A158R5Q3_9BILA
MDLRYAKSEPPPSDVWGMTRDDLVDLPVSHMNDYFPQQEIQLADPPKVENSTENFEDLMKYLTPEDFYNWDCEVSEVVQPKQEPLMNDISAKDFGNGISEPLQLGVSPFFENSNEISVLEEPKNLCSIKEEEYWDNTEMDSMVPGPSKLKETQETPEISKTPLEFNPKARKYNLKPDDVKKTPKYIDARKRNNIAVRKSRHKQKARQAEKDRELIDLKNQNKKFEEQIKQRDLRIADLEAENTFLYCEKRVHSYKAREDEGQQEMIILGRKTD